MGDQLKSGISVDVNFVSGETPSPAKLSAITAQVRRAALELEQAVGDIHGESYPYTDASPTTLSQAHGKHPETGVLLSGAEERRLDIANLARLIGPASNMNPRMINGERTVEEQIPVGVHEFELQYPVSGPLIDVSTTDPTMTLQRANPTNLQDPGDWSVTRGGKVFCVSETDGGTITYLTDSVEWNGGMNPQRSNFNVIPDPNQITNGSGCSIGALDGQGRRPVVLPLCTHQQSDIDGTSVVLDEQDLNYGVQLLLPRVLRDNLIAGDEIPAGFLYLKNETTGEVYEDGVYYYNSTSSILVGNVNLTSAILAGNKFSILTIGTDITTSIDDLRVKHFHSHDRTHGEPYVPVEAISGQLATAGDSGVFVPSDHAGNPFPQYLHRDGTRGKDVDNANDANAMRGDIVFGIETGGAGSYRNVSGDTFGVYFGDQDADAAWVRKSGGDESLEVYNGGAHINLQVVNTVVDPDDPSSNCVRARGGPVESEYGYRAPFSTNKGATVGLFATQATYSGAPDDLSYAINTLLSGTPLAEVEDYFWLDVQVSLYDPVDGHTAWPPNVTNPSTRQYTMYWDRPTTTSRLILKLIGTDWPNNTPINMNIMIWYLPTT